MHLVADATPAPTEAPAAPQVVQAKPEAAVAKPQVQAQARPAPTVTPTAPAAAAPAGFDNIVANIKAKGSVAEKALVQSLESYIAAMKPGMPVAGTRWRTVAIHSVAHYPQRDPSV
jgi:pyruvate/2-oxoglutarate dehydrogenase complex dihydrolipoamide acyltransferase (E2) component